MKITKAKNEKICPEIAKNEENSFLPLGWRVYSFVGFWEYKNFNVEEKKNELMIIYGCTKPYLL